MIPVTCQCGKSLRAPDSSAGKTAKCPACGELLKVPAAPVSKEQPAAAADTPAVVETATTESHPDSLSPIERRRLQNKLNKQRKSNSASARNPMVLLVAGGVGAILLAGIVGILLYATSSRSVATVVYEEGKEVRSEPKDPNRPRIDMDIFKQPDGPSNDANADANSPAEPEQPSGKPQDAPENHSPIPPEIASQLAEVEQKRLSGDYAASKLQITQLMQQYPDSFDVGLAYGKALESDFDFAAAEKHYLKLKAPSKDSLRQSAQHLAIARVSRNIKPHQVSVQYTLACTKIREDGDILLEHAKWMDHSFGHLSSKRHQLQAIAVHKNYPIPVRYEAELALVEIDTFYPPERHIANAMNLAPEYGDAYLMKAARLAAITPQNTEEIDSNLRSGIERKLVAPDVSLAGFVSTLTSIDQDAHLDQYLDKILKANGPNPDPELILQTIGIPNMTGVRTSRSGDRLLFDGQIDRDFAADLKKVEDLARRYPEFYPTAKPIMQAIESHQKMLSMTLAERFKQRVSPAVEQPTIEAALQQIAVGLMSKIEIKADGSVLQKKLNRSAITGSTEITGSDYGNTLSRLSDNVNFSWRPADDHVTMVPIRDVIRDAYSKADRKRASAQSSMEKTPTFKTSAQKMLEAVTPQLPSIDALIGEKKYDEALTKINELHAEYPRSADLNARLGDIYMAQKKYNDAALAYDAAESSTPYSDSKTKAEFSIKSGRALRYGKDPRKGAYKFYSAAQMGKKVFTPAEYGEVMLESALTEFESGNYSMAVSRADNQDLLVVPNEQRAKLEIVRTASLMSQNMTFETDSVRAAVSSLLRLAPDCGDAYLLLAQIESQDAANQDSAMENLRKGIEQKLLLPEVSAACIRPAIVNLGKQKFSRDFYLRALKTNDNNPYVAVQSIVFAAFAPAFRSADANRFVVRNSANRPWDKFEKELQQLDQSDPNVELAIRRQMDHLKDAEATMKLTERLRLETPAPTMIGVPMEMFLYNLSETLFLDVTYDKRNGPVSLTPTVTSTSSSYGRMLDQLASQYKFRIQYQRSSITISQDAAR